MHVRFLPGRRYYRVEIAAGDLKPRMREDLELLRGGIDIHVHSGPDLYPRIQDHVELALSARTAGMRALVIKIP